MRALYLTARFPLSEAVLDKASRLARIIDVYQIQGRPQSHIDRLVNTVWPSMKGCL